MDEKDKLIRNLLYKIFFLRNVFLSLINLKSKIVDVILGELVSFFVILLKSYIISSMMFGGLNFTIIPFLCKDCGSSELFWLKLFVKPVLASQLVYIPDLRAPPDLIISVILLPCHLILFQRVFTYLYYCQKLCPFGRLYFLVLIFDFKACSGNSSLISPIKRTII